MLVLLLICFPFFCVRGLMLGFKRYVLIFFLLVHFLPQVIFIVSFSFLVFVGVSPVICCVIL